MKNNLKNQKIKIYNNKSKLLLLGVSGILLGSSLFAGINIVKDFNIYPLPQNVTSESRGGTLPDSVAISDGVGTLLVHSINGNKKNESNKAYNDVIKSKFKIIKDNPTTKINDLITSNVINIDSNQLNNINNNKLVNPSISSPNVNTPDNICIEHTCQGNGNTYNNVFFLSPTGSNSNNCSYNEPCTNMTNVPSNSIVILKKGTYTQIFPLSNKVDELLVFQNIKSNMRIIGEDKTQTILNPNFSIATKRDRPIIDAKITGITNYELENLTINYKGCSSKSYTVSFSRFIDNSSFDNIIFNITGNYSLNYYNHCSSSGIVHYNNVVFNGGTKLDDYSCSEVISPTSSKPQGNFLKVLNLIP